MTYKSGNLVKSVEPISREAGAIVLSYFHKAIARTEKKDQGFATQADIASEQYIIQSLKNIMPEASFFAEESGKTGSGDYCWVIDPLDGTTNFAYGFPYFGISIALTYKNKPVFGMIFDPLHDELYWAEQDLGAYCKSNGETRQLSVSKTSELAQALILLSVPYAKDAQFAYVVAKATQLMEQTFAFRHMGAVALDQMAVALGRADGMFFTNLGWYDVAAGMLIIKEAGGSVSTFEGTVVEPSYRSYVAGNPEIYQKLRSSLAL